jgi:uncharacterized repeat protein (TIGR03803 family)
MEKDRIRITCSTAKLVRSAALGVLIVLANVSTAAGDTKLTTLYRFKGGPDGKYPSGGLLFDDDGRLYGTTRIGGDSTCGGGCGTVFRLTPPVSGGARWKAQVLHAFKGSLGDGYWPRGGLISDPSGALYGTTYYGGRWSNGTVFRLTPPGPTEAEWSESILHSFNSRDGVLPSAGLIRDDSGALYGTTAGYPTISFGTVFRLVPRVGGHPGWRRTTLHKFRGGRDGAYPETALVRDPSGKVYGTTAGGDFCHDTGCISVFMLTPPEAGSEEWDKTTLYKFSGAVPRSALIRDDSGTLYGTTYSGPTGCGTVFKLIPPAAGESRWRHEVIRQFTTGDDGGCHISSKLLLDPSGALYGTTEETVFKLSPPASGGGTWSFAVLHSFIGDKDGAEPSELIFDESGALYGTTLSGGDEGCKCGTVFKLTP